MTLPLPHTDIPPHDSSRPLPTRPYRSQTNRNEFRKHRGLGTHWQEETWWNNVQDAEAAVTSFPTSIPLRTLTQIILLSSGARVIQFNNKIGEG